MSLQIKSRETFVNVDTSLFRSRISLESRRTRTLIASRLIKTKSSFSTNIFCAFVDVCGRNTRIWLWWCFCLFAIFWCIQVCQENENWLGKISWNAEELHRQMMGETHGIIREKQQQDKQHHHYWRHNLKVIQHECSGNLKYKVEDEWWMIFATRQSQQMIFSRRLLCTNYPWLLKIAFQDNY